MITVENRLGSIVYSKKYLKTLIKNTVLKCYGVSGLFGHAKHRWFRFGIFKHKNEIAIKKSNQSVLVDIHIRVKYGLNVAQIVKSIKNKVNWAIKDNTGIFADEINVFVDNVKE